MNPTLIYFDVPGRGEVARLLFTLGKIEFEDKRITFEQWSNPDSNLKAQMPFGQVPLLQVEGQQLAQMAAIDHYAAKLAGFMPEDPWQAALADQAYFFWEDIMKPVTPCRLIKDPEARKKAWQELVAGPLADNLKLLTKLVESRPGKYLAGDKLTHGDLATFVCLSALQSGFFEGIATNILDSYPVLKEFRHSIATLPEIVDFYSKEEDDVRNTGFKA